MWLEPEDAAFVAARAIAALAASDLGGEVELPQLPPQGEYRFPAANTPEAMAAATSDRFGAVEEAAHAGDALAMHTLGLLHYSGVGGASWDERESAYWHAAAAAAGNVEALATLGGCVRRGVGALPDEPTGVAIIEACAAAGSPVGLVKLGVLHEEGELFSGLPADPTRAAQLFQQAAAARHLGHGRAGAGGGGGTGPGSELAGGGSEADGEGGDGFSEAVFPLKPRQSALGLFQHGFALMYGIGAPRDVEEAAAAWLAAAKLAPDDGSEEAAWGLYNEQGAMPPALRRRVNPDRCLRLAAALEHEHAVAELSLRQSRKRESRSADGRPDADGRKRERFTRESLNKARAWTERDERAEAYLDQLMGG